MSQQSPDAVSVAAGRCPLSCATLGISSTVFFSSQEIKCIAWCLSSGLIVFPILLIVLEICTLKSIISLAVLEYFVQRLATTRVGQMHYHSLEHAASQIGTKRYFPKEYCVTKLLLLCTFMSLTFLD